MVFHIGHDKIGKMFKYRPAGDDPSMSTQDKLPRHVKSALSCKIKSRYFVLKMHQCHAKLSVNHRYITTLVFCHHYQIYYSISHAEIAKYNFLQSKEFPITVLFILQTTCEQLHPYWKKGTVFWKVIQNTHGSKFRFMEFSISQFYFVIIYMP